jgi:hypothetical protein
MLVQVSTEKDILSVYTSHRKNNLNFLFIPDANLYDTKQYLINKFGDC